MAFIPATAIRLVLSATVLSMSFIIGNATAKAVKPQISTLPDASIPRGCGYSLDDWKKTTLAWAPYPNGGNTQAKRLLLVIDGTLRAIPISSRDERHISAHDSTYAVDIQTPRWKRVDTELYQARATLLLKNTEAHTATNMIYRASEGC